MHGAHNTINSHHSAQIKLVGSTWITVKDVFSYYDCVCLAFIMSLLLQIHFDVSNAIH